MSLALCQPKNNHLFITVMEQLQTKFSQKADTQALLTDLNVMSRSDQDILEEINTEEVVRLIPLIIFLLIISITGIPGNGLVCYIYRSKYSTSSSRWFIFFLGAVDLFLCVVIIPCEIATTFQQYTFTDPIWCKLSVFFNLWVLLCLGLTLVIVSVDRYRKVCKPLGWQINFRKGRRLCIVAIVVAFVVSSPVLAVYDIYEIPLANSNITATECSFRKSAEESKFAFLFVLFGMTVFSAALFTICILYCFIGREIKIHIKKAKLKRHISLTASMARKSDYIRPVESLYGHQTSQRATGVMSPKAKRSVMFVSPKLPKRSVMFVSVVNNNANNANLGEGEKPSQLTVPQTNSLSLAREISCSMESLDMTSDRFDSTFNDADDISSNNMASEDDICDRPCKKQMTRLQKTKSKRVRRARARKATFSMFLISLAFVLSYLPFLCLLLARSAQDGFDESLSDAARAVYKFFLRSYFLNCAINPFIYGISDSKFRKSCKDVISAIRDRLLNITKFRLN